LTEKGLEFESVNYIEKPLSAAGLKQLLQHAGLRPHEVLRSKEDAYKNHVAGQDLTDEQLIAVMTKHPEVVQRPIVLRDGKAVVAREKKSCGNWESSRPGKHGGTEGLQYRHFAEVTMEHMPGLTKPLSTRGA